MYKIIVIITIEYDIIIQNCLCQCISSDNNNKAFIDTDATQGWIYWGGGGGVCACGVCAPPLARGGAGGAGAHPIKQKTIRGKMRYSNLSNNMMISEL